MIRDMPGQSPHKVTGRPSLAPARPFPGDLTVGSGGQSLNDFMLKPSLVFSPGFAFLRRKFPAKTTEIAFR
jgi:hypothetical protein